MLKNRGSDGLAVPLAMISLMAGWTSEEKEVTEKGAPNLLLGLPVVVNFGVGEKREGERQRGCAHWREGEVVCIREKREKVERDGGMCGGYLQNGGLGLGWVILKRK